MAKKFLTKQQIEMFTEKKSRRYIRNPEKRQLFAEIINSNFLKRKGNESRITAFNKLWNKSQRVARIIYGKDTSISQRSKISANFAREHTYYRSSFLSNFTYSKKVSVQESVRNAEYKTYMERTKKFREKYGDFTVKGEVLEGIDNLTLNEYFEMFKNGEIDKETMNEVLDFFKTGTDYYKGQVGSD